MITAKMQGRRLSLTVETEPDEKAVPPFLIEPLSAREGRELSTRYLFAVEGIPFDGDQAADMIRALGAENYERADTTLSQAEGELLAQAAYFWQSVGGLPAVQALLSIDDKTGEQGGEAGAGKALGVFRLRSVPLLQQIRRNLESARRTLAESTPATASPDGGEKNGSEPDGSPRPQPTPPQPPSSNPDSSPATSD